MSSTKTKATKKTTTGAKPKPAAKAKAAPKANTKAPTKPATPKTVKATVKPSTEPKAANANATAKAPTEPTAKPAVAAAPAGPRYSHVVQADGYAAAVQVFDGPDARARAEARRRDTGEGTVVRGTQMWNEPVGQVEEDYDDAPTATATVTAKPATTASPEPTTPAEAPAKPVAASDAQPTTRTAAKPLSCLDAAVAVLRASREPMTCKAMVAAMTGTGLWSTTAPTPHATLSSAILRETQRKGDKGRFRKTSPGHFALAAHAR